MKTHGRAADEADRPSGQTRRGLRAPLGDVTIEPLRQRHLGAVLAIERRCYPQPWSVNLFTSELSQPNRHYLVALVRKSGSPWRLWRRRTIVGYAGIMVQVGEAHITTIAVHPAHHRRKVASRLMVELLDEAIRRGAEAATLEVRAGNQGAQRLYSQFGFAPVGVRPKYYAESGEDAVIMWAYDLQSEGMRKRLRMQAQRLGEPGGASGSPDLPVPWVKGRIGLDGGDGGA